MTISVVSKDNRLLLYGAETWTLRKVHAQALEACEMWLWRRMEKSSWMQKVTNEEVLRRVQEEMQLLGNIRKTKRNWLGHIMRRKENIIKDALEGMVGVKEEEEEVEYNC